MIFQQIKPQGSRITELVDQAQITKQSMGALVDYVEVVAISSVSQTYLTAGQRSFGLPRKEKTWKKQLVRYCTTRKSSSPGRLARNAWRL